MKEDTLGNYEVGAKGSLWDRRVSFDAAVYYVDWQDVQQQLIVPVPIIVNPGGQESLFVNGESVSGIGFDFTVSGAVTDRLELGVNASWNDLKFDADVISGGVVFFAKGERPNNSMEYTAGASADYTFPIGVGGFEGRFSTSANYTSKQSERTLAAGTVRVASGNPMFIATTSFSVRAPANWTAALFVDNLLDERATPQSYYVPTGTVNNQHVRVRPRTIGLQIEYHY